MYNRFKNPGKTGSGIDVIRIMVGATGIRRTDLQAKNKFNDLQRTYAAVRDQEKGTGFGVDEDGVDLHGPACKLGANYSRRANRGFFSFLVLHFEFFPSDDNKLRKLFKFYFEWKDMVGDRVNVDPPVISEMGVPVGGSRPGSDRPETLLEDSDEDIVPPVRSKCLSLAAISVWWDFIAWFPAGRKRPKPATVLLDEEAAEDGILPAGGKENIPAGKRIAFSGPAELYARLHCPGPQSQLLWPFRLPQPSHHHSATLIPMSRLPSSSPPRRRGAAASTSCWRATLSARYARAGFAPRPSTRSSS